MSCVLNLKLVDDCDKFSQKCFIPLHLLPTLNVKIREFVMIKSGENSFICCVFCMSDPIMCVVFDDVVACTSYRICPQLQYLNIPDSFCKIKLSVFNRLQVKVILAHDSPQQILQRIDQNIIHKILSPYVFGKNMSVNCCGQKLTKLFGVHSIIILETFCNKGVFGRLKQSTNIDIVEIITVQQMLELISFEDIELGGLDYAMKYLTMSLDVYPKNKNTLLVLGPSGAGKSSLVKKFCANVKCFFMIIDGLKDQNLTVKMCDSYINCFTQSMKTFPNRTSMLLIDHIDILTPDSKPKSIQIIARIVRLIKRLSNIGVIIVAATTCKKLLHSSVSCLFYEEVVLGIPSLYQRKEIFEALLKPFSCNKVDCDKLSRLTPGFVGHDIKLLMKEVLNTRKQRMTDMETAVDLTTEDFEQALLTLTPTILKHSNWNMKVKPVYWKDIGGMDEIKKRLQMCIEWPLRNPEIFRKVNLPCPRGVLLFGPPGCCKTTLARGLATACNANFFAANPAQIYSPYVGESEKNLTQLFYQARLSSPSIIFLDELDSLVARRKFETKSQGIGEKVLSTLLNEMDGFGTKTDFQMNVQMKKLLECSKNMESENSNDVIVVAATNRPDLIDDALLRPGRFDVVLYVPPPNTEERESILFTLTRGMPIENVDLKQLAFDTELFSGADLKNLCNRAAMNSLRIDLNAQFITDKHFREALKSLHPSISREQVKMYEQLSSKYGPLITEK